MENADRWVAGFLEKFEEGCHSMVSSLRIERMLLIGVHCSFMCCFQNFFRGQPSRRGSRRGSSRHNPVTLVASYSTTATILMKPMKMTRMNYLKMSRNSASVHIYTQDFSSCKSSCQSLRRVMRPSFGWWSLYGQKVGQAAMLLAALDVCSGNARS